MRELAHRVANASLMYWKDAYDAIKSVIQRFNDVPVTDDIRKQLEAIYRHVNKVNKGKSGYFDNSPQRRELVTRRPARLMVAEPRLNRKRYRRIRRRREKRSKSHARAS